MSFPNVYAHRKVADTAMKGCDICFRPTSSVLFSQGTDAKDFFFVCPAHLQDRKFCTAIVDDAAEARKKKAMDDEVERVRKEYEEKKKEKEKKAAEKEKKDEDKDEDKDKDKDNSKDKEGKEDDKTKEGKDEKKSEATPSPSGEEARFFALQRVFFSQRVQKKREAEMAKRNRERLQQPNLFPSVPKNLPGT